MKFSSFAVLAVVAPLAAGFAPTANQRQFAARSNVASTAPRSTARGAMSMELSDLEKKLLDPTPSGPPARASKPKPQPKAKQTKKVEPAPAPTPAPEPVKAKGKKSKGGYDLSGVETSKPKPAPKPTPVKVEKPKVEKPKKVAPPPKKAAPAAPKPSAPVVKDDNAVPTGVALGAAPLVLAPLALLGAGRGILSGTKERREKIQKEIADFEAAKQKKAIDSEVDGAGLATALVGS